MSKPPLNQNVQGPFARVGLAIAYGALCHAAFVLGSGAMVLAMYFGMSRSLGPFGFPWSWAVNALLLTQFPLIHSFLLTRSGQHILTILAPNPNGATLATTTYAFIASVQIFALFALWSPSGVIWWRAGGLSLWLMTGLYTISWLLLIKALFDAGVQLQIGLLGWWALLRGVKPVYPEMPTSGLFRFTRQPIYLGFALTLWTVPTWTPDQFAIAIVFTSYCIIGPRHKEHRFSRLFGTRFDAYRARTPYWLPIPARKRPFDGE